MKKKFVFIPKSQVISEEQENINNFHTQQEQQKKQRYKRREQQDSNFNQYDQNQENENQVYQCDNNSFQVSKQLSFEQNKINRKSNDQDSTKNHGSKSKQQYHSTFKQQDFSQESKRQIYQNDKNTLQMMDKLDFFGLQSNNVDSSNQDSTKKARYKRKEQQEITFEQQDFNQMRKTQVDQFDKKSQQINKQMYLKQDYTKVDNFNQDSTKKFIYIRRDQQDSVIEQQDSNEESKEAQVYQLNKNHSYQNTQVSLEQDCTNVDNSNQDSTKKIRFKRREQNDNIFDQQDLNQESQKLAYQNDKNGLQTSKYVSLEQKGSNRNSNSYDITKKQRQIWRQLQNNSQDQQDFDQESKRKYNKKNNQVIQQQSTEQDNYNNNNVDDSNQESTKKYQYKWRQQKASIFDQVDNNQENKTEDQNIDKFYLHMIKDKKSLFINNFKIFNACLSSMANYELPQILNINFDLIFKKISTSINEDTLFQGLVYNLQLSDSYQLIFSEKDQSNEYQQIFKKDLKQQQQILSVKQLIQIFLQRFPTNTKKLSLKIDQNGAFLQELQQNLDIAKNKLQQLNQLEIVKLDFSVYQNNNLDKEFNYFEILNQIVTLKKLKITINQSQLFNNSLRQYFGNKNIDLTIEIKFRPQLIIDINIFNFLKDICNIKLKINMSEIDLNIYDISTIDNFFFLSGKNISSLHFIKNTFKFDSTIYIKQKFYDILNKVMKNLSFLEIDNAFINVDQNSQPEKKNQVKQILQELCKNYNGNLIISINPHIFKEFSNYFETANFSSLQINFDNEQFGEQLEALKILSQFTNLDKIIIKITINIESKYSLSIIQLIDILKQFDQRYQLDLTLTFQKVKERILDYLTINLVKSLLNFSQFNLTWYSNFLNKEIMKNIKDNQLKNQIFHSILALQKLDIKTEYSFKRHNLFYLYDD
ncbi:hypothetical protein TTHERM_01111070 (macronuclear) [Tetrahymena thermophila SB210]|uniref:Uncharacterized protein n=1 Tax=Tetrahymena thermophila (strain SB210) TaxID=312017 RepID=Q24D47_TETTS|nr:hypothetical protein TTHERM_01111070 [Tetrahymena thermophila SB210]EAS05694.3 hypothetical protein TTHERM_01111070 [Tetrahymena thermophila SB210]|eukprot:XP_001025939.3 hypothetical protein TTHERM_01111070 [Tetrahymena thermophila SB210]